MPYYPFQQPVVTYGTAAGRANYGLDRRTTGEQDQNKINARLARQNLNDPNLDDRNRARLQEILQEADPVARKQAQAAATFQWQQLAKEGANPNSGMTTSEFNSARDEWKRQNTASVLPMPLQLYKRKVEDTDPDVLLTNAADEFAKEYGVSSSWVKYQLRVDKKLGELDPTATSKFIDRMEKRRESRSVMSSANRASTAKLAASVEKQLKGMRANVDFVDDNGNLQERPELRRWAPAASVRNRAAYDVFAAKFNAALETQKQVEALTASFVNFGDDNVDTGAPDAVTDVSAVSPSAFPQSAPYTPKPGEDLAVTMRDLQEQATRNRASIWVMGSKGIPVEIKPKL